MFENIGSFFRRMVKPEQKELGSKDAAKERLHLVLMQDRANVSSEFLELMKQEILDVIKKYIIVDESQIDVRLTNQSNDDGTTGAPSLYANIPIINIKNEMLVDKVKEFDGKTNSINFGEYKMVIETSDNNEGKEEIENKEEFIDENNDQENKELIEEINSEVEESDELREDETIKRAENIEENVEVQFIENEPEEDEYDDEELPKREKSKQKKKAKK